MSESDNIKALIPVICPHCSNTLVVEFLIGANLLTPEETAKILVDPQVTIPVPTTVEVKVEEDIKVKAKPISK